jgi:hypothetical protein
MQSGGMSRQAKTSAECLFSLQGNMLLTFERIEHVNGSSSSRHAPNVVLSGFRVFCGHGIVASTSGGGGGGGSDNHEFLYDVGEMRQLSMNGAGGGDYDC